jgi:hypothetical protein
MQIFIILYLIFSLNLLAGDLYNEILIDEFTDEESVALTFSADEDNEIFRKWGQIVCNEGSLLIGLKIQIHGILKIPLE